MSDIFTKETSFPRTKPTIVLGRDSSCDIVLKGAGVSRCHAIINVSSNDVIVEDKKSSFGTRVNGIPVNKVPLSSGSVITIGVNQIRIDFTSQTIDLTPIHETVPGHETTITMKTETTVTIGRDPSNTMCLLHPMVSRFHATVHKSIDGVVTIEDHSTNATFVNGIPARNKLLLEGDIVQIGPYRLFLDNGILKQTQDFNRIKIEAFDIAVKRSNHTIVNNISIAIEPGEFVAILGPSGAGKSTLAQALTGQAPLASGSVFYNGLPMGKFCSAFNSAIGFVSQHNLLRPELTVLETFREQCMLRLSADSLPVERSERINEVMTLLDVTHLSNRHVAHLSGGEAKRVHFGIELLSSPTVIFLDEPLAGLDPGLTHKFMELFRHICDKGHTLLLTTHTLEQIDLCNKVLFVSEGELFFSGTPQDMRSTYGANTLSDVYQKARLEHPLGAERKKLGSGTPKNKGRLVKREYKSSVKLYRPKPLSLYRQLSVLLRRYSTICLRDIRTLLLMILQAPLIAFLLSLVFDPDNSFLPLSFYFCITISVIWLGGTNSVREISKEWALIEREFRIGLSCTAYVLSKLLVFGILATVQAVVFGFCLQAFFPHFAFSVSHLILLAVACCGGTLLGLGISSLSSNVTMAISFLPIIFIPQIFFSGILMPFDEMPDWGRALSHCTFSRPVFSMFKKMSFFDQSLLVLSDWKGIVLLSSGLIILLFLAVQNRRIFIGRNTSL